MNSIKAHCNICNGEKNHEILHQEKTYWDDYECGMKGDDTYETLKCMGCDNIKLRHVSFLSIKAKGRKKQSTISRPKYFGQNQTGSIRFGFLTIS